MKSLIILASLISLSAFAVYPDCGTYKGVEKLACIGSNYRDAREYSKALDYFKKGCDLNDASSCYQADDLLRKNLKRPADAKSFRDKACKLEKTFICDIQF